MTKKNLILFIALGLLSCSTKDEPEVLPPVQLTWKFVEIRYFVDENSTISTKNELVSSGSFSNGSSVTQFFITDVLENVREYSYFESSDELAFSLFSEPVPMPTFSATLEDTVIANNLSSSFLYSPNFETAKAFAPSDNQYNVLPNTVVTIWATIEIKRITLAYKLTLKAEQTGQEKVITGTWSGSRATLLKIAITSQTFNQ